MKFSILICSLYNRSDLLYRLLSRLKKQLDECSNKNVEVLINIDGGEKSIGSKRNELLKHSKGEYIAFIDDDDLVDKEYIKKIMGVLDNNDDIDCVGFCGNMIINNKDKKKFIHSIKYKKWFTKKGIHYRCPNHLNPVKRIHALKVRFPEIDMGEDKTYSERLIKHLKTEEFIDHILYTYLYNSNKKRRKYPNRQSNTNRKIMNNKISGIINIDELSIKSEPIGRVKNKKIRDNKRKISRIPSIRKINKKPRKKH